MAGSLSQAAPTPTQQFSFLHRGTGDNIGSGWREDDLPAFTTAALRDAVARNAVRLGPPVVR